MKRAALAVVATAVMVLLSACDTSPGVVTGKHMTTLGGATHYFVTVKHDKSGHASDEDVDLGIYSTCSHGDRWPECAK